MRFSDTFRLGNYLLALVGFIAVISTQFFSPLLLLLPLITIALAEYPPTKRLLRAIPDRFFTTVLIVIFAYLLLVEFIFREDLVAAVLYLTVALQLVKLISARKHRDYFQIYILAFAHLIAATMLTTDLIFVLPFVLFIVLAPWAFTLFNLKVQLEQATLGDEASTTAVEHLAEPSPAARRTLNQLRSRGVVSRRFFALTALLSVTLLACTMTVFFFFPRVSFGYLLKRIKPRQTISGFSERVDFNSFGEIKLNNAVVLRAEFPERTTLQRDQLYWRGLAFDTYEDNEWKRARPKRHRLPVGYRSQSVTLHEGLPEPYIRPEIFLAPLETSVVFVPDRAVEIGWNKLRIERMMRRDFAVATDRYGALFFASNHANDRVYRTVSAIQPPTPEVVRDLIDPSAINQRKRFRLQPYLQLPTGSQRLKALARTILERRGLTEGNWYDQARAIQRHLLEEYQYTLNIPDQGEQPIERFLFDTRLGNCEYFATAGVLLMRAAGIPARLVSGFRGGGWNEYGRYITVRQRNAHTWVEAYIPGGDTRLGWMRFDPTPPDERAVDFADLRFAKLRELIEYFEHRWYKYIINYDLQSQYRFARSIFKGTMRTLRLDGDRGQSRLQQLLAKFKRRRGDGNTSGLDPLWIVTLIIPFGLWFGWRLWMGARRRRSQQSAVRFFTRYEAILTRQKLQRPSSTTVREHLTVVCERHPDLATQLHQLVTLYYAIRFGEHRASETELRQVEATLDRLEQASQAPRSAA